jgi:hypothetical protein
MINPNYVEPWRVLSGINRAIRSVNNELEIIWKEAAVTYSTYYYPSIWLKGPRKTMIRNPDSAVGIATGYGLDDRGVWIRVQVVSRIFSSPRHPHRLLGPPNLLSNGYRGLFPRGLRGRGEKLPTHLQLVPRSRKMWIYTTTPLYAFMA